MTQIRKFVGGDVAFRGPLGTVLSAVEDGSPDHTVGLVVPTGPGAQAVLEAYRARRHRVGRFRHPFVVRDRGVGLFDGKHTMVFDPVEGVSLATALSDAPFPVSVATAVAARLARVLHAGWDRMPRRKPKPYGLIHGDLSPEHIIVGLDGELRVFGMGSGVPGSLVPRDALRRKLVFPSAYTAPEALAGRDSHAADVYALAAILAHMLTGRLPSFASNQKEWHEGTVGAISDKVNELTGVSALGELVGWCMAFRPSTRPPASEVHDWLERVQRSAESPEPEAWLTTRVPFWVDNEGESLELNRLDQAGSPSEDAWSPVPEQDAVPWDAPTETPEDREPPAAAVAIREVPAPLAVAAAVGVAAALGVDDALEGTVLADPDGELDSDLDGALDDDLDEELSSELDEELSADLDEDLSADLDGDFGAELGIDAERPLAHEAATTQIDVVVPVHGGSAGLPDSVPTDLGLADAGDEDVEDTLPPVEESPSSELLSNPNWSGVQLVTEARRVPEPRLIPEQRQPQVRAEGAVDRSRLPRIRVRELDGTSWSVADLAAAPEPPAQLGHSERTVFHQEDERLDYPPPDEPSLSGDEPDDLEGTYANAATLLPPPRTDDDDDIEVVLEDPLGSVGSVAVAAAVSWDSPSQPSAFDLGTDDPRGKLRLLSREDAASPSTPVFLTPPASRAAPPSEPVVSEEASGAVVTRRLRAVARTSPSSGGDDNRGWGGVALMVGLAAAAMLAVWAFDPFTSKTPETRTSALSSVPSASPPPAAKPAPPMVPAPAPSTASPSSPSSPAGAPTGTGSPAEAGGAAPVPAPVPVPAAAPKPKASPTPAPRSRSRRSSSSGRSAGTKSAPPKSAARKAPAPAPAPEPAPAPAPEAEAPAPAVPKGVVSFSGDAVSVKLVGDAGTFGAGSVPAGRYSVLASFGEGQPLTSVGTVSVAEGDAVSVVCRGAFLVCRPQ